MAREMLGSWYPALVTYSIASRPVHGKDNSMNGTSQMGFQSYVARVVDEWPILDFRSGKRSMYEMSAERSGSSKKAQQTSKDIEGWHDS